MVGTEPSSAPGDLAVRLQASIDNSGLFYESHLQRWYGGFLPRARLEQEPQMLRFGDKAGTGAALVPEDLRAVVRHQLELLATQVLRWEVDVCSGIFMALALQCPAVVAREWYADGERDDAEGETEDAWHCELLLDVARLGQVRVSLRIARERLTLTLAAPSEAVRGHLEGHLADLEARLAACGFDAVAVNVTSVEESR